MLKNSTFSLKPNVVELNLRAENVSLVIEIRCDHKISWLQSGIDDLRSENKKTGFGAAEKLLSVFCPMHLYNAETANFKCITAVFCCVFSAATDVVSFFLASQSDGPC